MGKLGLLILIKGTNLGDLSPPLILINAAELIGTIS